MEHHLAARRRGRLVRGVTLGSILLLTATTMAGCALPFPLPGPGGGEPDAASGIGSLDDLKSAVIQIQAQGTFVDPSEGGYETAGRGSGFLISADGLAVTNNHVVVGAGTLDVWRGGDQSKTLNAKVLGSSECLDLAVIQLSGKDFPFLEWREGEIETATDVYAAGFPLGDPAFTMTRGIVSKASTPGETPWASLDSVIEHDARIRSGNSGGPLVDDEGRVLGVNYAGNDQYDTNLAIHRDEVLDVIDRLSKGEDVLSLGINGQALVDEEGYGLGVWVSSVAAGSPADKAGIIAGDLLTRLQGVSVGADGTLSDYCDVLRTHGTDAALDVELYRTEDGASYRGQIGGDKPLTAVQVTGGDGQASGAFVDAVDDSGKVYAQVPADWSDFDGAPITDAHGIVWNGFSVAPDLDAFRNGWDSPGVMVLASQQAVGTVDHGTLLAETGATIEPQGCVSEGASEYDDGYHVGTFQTWSGCGGVGAAQVVVAATSYSGDYMVYVAIQAVSEDDLAVIDRVLGSFVAEL